MPSHVVTRRPHTVTRNGKTFNRSGSTYKTNGVLIAKALGAGACLGVLSTAGLPVGASVLIVGGAWLVIANRKRIAKVAKPIWRGTKKVGKGTWKAGNAVRDWHEIANTYNRPKRPALKQAVSQQPGPQPITVDTVEWHSTRTGKACINHRRFDINCGSCRVADNRARA